MIVMVLITRNIFYYGVALLEDHIIMYKLNEALVAAKTFMESRVHEICDVHNYGYLLFRPRFEQCNLKIKVYQMSCDEILFVIQH